MSVLTKTSHPLQRAGVYGFIMLGAHHKIFDDEVSVEDISKEQVNAVVGYLVNDLLQAAMTTKQDTNGWKDWWNVLMGTYPNSPIIQPSRPKEKQQMRAKIEPLFVEDKEESELICFFCDRLCHLRWGKSLLPLSSAAQLNTSQDGKYGVPICQGCRISMWCIPYASNLIGAKLTVLTSENTDLELAFAQESFTKVQLLQVNGRTRAGLRRSESVAVDVISQNYTSDKPAYLWSFKNDNREVSLLCYTSRGVISQFLKAKQQNSKLLSAWHLLARLNGGYDELNRELFIKEKNTHYDNQIFSTDPILRKISDAISNKKYLDKLTPFQYENLTNLAITYYKEMYSMKVDVIPSVSDFIVTWIKSSGNPRGRFNEYATVAFKGKLNSLLLRIQYELYRDGKETHISAKDFEILLSEQAWQTRQILFFAVVEKLISQGVQISTGTDEKEIDDVIKSIEESTTIEGE